MIYKLYNGVTIGFPALLLNLSLEGPSWQVPGRRCHRGGNVKRELTGIALTKKGGTNKKLGGGFKYVLLSPLFGEDFQFD